MQLLINVSLWHYHIKLSSVNRLYRQPTSFFYYKKPAKTYEYTWQLSVHTWNKNLLHRLGECYTVWIQHAGCSKPVYQLHSIAVYHKHLVLFWSSYIQVSTIIPWGNTYPSWPLKNWISQIDAWGEWPRSVMYFTLLKNVKKKGRERYLPDSHL